MGDLFFNGNDSNMIKGFKKSMLNTYDMTDLRKMRHFLEVEIMQDNEGIFMCQQRNVIEILDKFGMNQRNVMCSPIIVETKISK